MADLDTNQKQFFGSMEDTFRTKGWTLLTQGWRDEQQALPEMMFFNAKSMADIEAARVRYGLLNELITLPQTIAGQREQIEQMDPDNG